jgi:hypothetical protein
MYRVLDRDVRESEPYEINNPAAVNVPIIYCN